MTPSRSITLTLGLLASGLAAWGVAGRALVARPDLDVPLNPLGIQGSPYGEVFALAMQGPIDQTFQGGLLGRVGTRASKTPDQAEERKDRPFSLTRFLTSLDKASQLNTNPKAASEAHRRFLRRQAEDKLRFAYRLDPSQYSNYNSLHFFLTEPQVGTRPELTQSAKQLARETIEYCMREKNDPRPSLTAAAACTNMLHLMFAEHRTGSFRHTTRDMRQYLAQLDTCLARYQEIAKQWDASGNWSLLSPQRIQECEERFEFISKIRHAAAATIAHLEGEKSTQQVAN